MAKKHESKIDMQEMMEVYTKLGTPGVPHKALASMVGNWAAKVKSGVSPVTLPWNPQATPNRKWSLGDGSCSMSFPAR
jgi:hypothetical protein